MKLLEGAKLFAYERQKPAADLALYSAKGGGRGRACLFNPEMNAAVLQRRALDADMRDAITRESISRLSKRDADALAIRPANAPAAKAGAPVDVILL